MEKWDEKKYEPVWSRGAGYPNLGGSTTKKTLYFLRAFPKVKSIL